MAHNHSQVSLVLKIFKANCYSDGFFSQEHHSGINTTKLTTDRPGVEAGPGCSKG
jgi:hypothetical protein